MPATEPTAYVPANVPRPIGPLARDPESITPANQYRHGDKVLVWKASDWRPGEVTAGGDFAVGVRFEFGYGRTAVDTVTAEYLRLAGGES